MASLTTEQLIKLILGILVFAAVVFAVYLFFKERVIDFFQNFVGGNESAQAFLGLYD